MYIIAFISVSACVEPFEFETRDIENILVVEATITNEFVKHKVILGKAANLENVNVEPYSNNVNTSSTSESSEIDTRIPEVDARIVLIDDLCKEFSFSEIEDGIYESEIPFATETGRSYQLQITRSNSDFYASTFREAQGTSVLENIYAERTVDDTGTEGMAIYADGADASNTLKYFRYTYEETYKIIAPNWTPVEFEIIREVFQFDEDDNPLWPAVRVVPRAQEEQVCYKTVNSSDINLADADLLGQSISERKLIRFIDRNNPILSHRYSILVKQYAISSETFGYYQILENFSKSESVFSEIQPGFLEGNIKAEDEKNIVIGHFDVASVSEKRLFFDYDEFFPEEDVAAFFFDVNCSRLLSPPLGDPALDGPPSPDGQCPEPLPSRIKRETIEYLDVNGDPGICEGPYYVTPRICGDCTTLGSNVKPDFWIEE